MEWSREATIQLNELFRENKLLWDCRSKDYKNRQLQIAEKLQVEKDAVEKKIKSLIAQFQREIKKTKTHSGDGIDDIYVSKWFAFRCLMFLKDKNKPRPTVEVGINKVNEETSVQTEKDSNGSQVNEETSVEMEKNCNCSNMPKTATTKKVKRQHDSIAREAYDVMKSLQNKSQEKDEFSIYGDYVACKLRKLATPHAQIMTQYHINQILHFAELGTYNYPAPQMPQQHPNSATVPANIAPPPLPSPVYSEQSYETSKSSANDENFRVPPYRRPFSVISSHDEQDDIDRLLYDLDNNSQ